MALLSRQYATNATPERRMNAMCEAASLEWVVVTCAGPCQVRTVREGEETGPIYAASVVNEDDREAVALTANDRVARAVFRVLSQQDILPPLRHTRYLGTGREYFGRVDPKRPR